MRPPAARPSPALPAACSSQGSTRAQGEARMSRPRGAGQHCDAAPPASWAPPASAGSRAHPRGTGRPVTGGLGVGDKAPRGPPSHAAPPSVRPSLWSPEPPSLSREQSGGSRQLHSPQRLGLLPRAQPQALLSVSTVSSSEKPQVYRNTGDMGEAPKEKPKPARLPQPGRHLGTLRRAAGTQAFPQPPRNLRNPGQRSLEAQG